MKKKEKKYLFESKLEQHILEWQAANKQRLQIKELAEITGVSKASLFRLLRSDHLVQRIDSEVFLPLAEFFGVPWYKLVELVEVTENE